jgi:VCBS repeat-containing protein
MMMSRYLLFLIAINVLFVPSMGQGSGNLLPDLTIKDFSVPTGIKPGMTAEIVVTFTNQGDRDASPFSLNGYAFNAGNYQYMLESGEVPISGLKAGETQTETLTIAVPPDAPSGPWDVQVTIDNPNYSGQGSVVEKNENNNEKWVRNIALPSQEAGAPQEVTFQVYRTITTDQGSWKQNCNHYELAVTKDGMAVDLGTGGGVAEETNGVLTVYLSSGNYGYKIGYRYPGSDQMPMKEGETAGEFTVTEDRLSFVEVDTSAAPTPSPEPKPEPSLMPSDTTTTMHPTKEEIDRWIMLYESDPDVPGTRSQTSLNIMQYPGASEASSGTFFSLLDYLSYDPYERDQGDCGNCWEWTSTGVMEVALAYKNGIKDRLSVQYLNSNMKDKACCGNCIETASQFYEDSKMAIPWSNTNAQYSDGEGSCGWSAVPASSISTADNYPIKSIQAQKIPTHGVGKEVAIDNIKLALHKGQAVYFSFYLPNKGEWDKFNDFWQNQPESAVWQLDSACGKTYDYEGGSAHAVLLVGYDETDPNNRYWIVLNSWGTRSGRPNGLFSANMDMDYDCKYTNRYAFFFQTLDINYDIPSKEVPIPKPEPTPKQEPMRLIDHAMARGFDRTIAAPEDVTETFSTEDSAAVSALKIGPVTGSHPIQWRWYSPDGALYASSDDSINPSNMSDNVWAWSKLFIKGSDAEGMPGDWRAEISLDGQHLLTEQFTIERPGGYFGSPQQLPTLNIEINNDVYTQWDPSIYYCPSSSGAISVQNRIYLTGFDLDKVASVTYILHPTFENPEITTNDASNDFGIQIMAWGGFEMKAIITTKSGQVFEKSFDFTFRDKVLDAQAMGVPMVMSC